MTELEEMEGEQGSLRFPSMDILRDRQIVRGMEEKDKRRKGYESMRRNEEERKKSFKEAIKKKRDKGLYNRISSMNYWDDASPAFKKRREEDSKKNLRKISSMDYWDDASPAFKKRREEDSKKRRFKKRSSSSFSIPL
jgi:hypothetical protein